MQVDSVNYQPQRLPQTYKPPSLLQAVIALNAKGTEPDIDVLQNCLPVPRSRAVHIQVSRLHHAGLAAHRDFIAAIVLSAEGTEPERDM